MQWWITIWLGMVGGIGMGPAVKAMEAVEPAMVRSAVEARLQQITADEDAGPVDGDPGVARLLSVVRREYGVPALAGAIVTSKGCAVMGVAGVRKQGTDTACEINDVWHLGSETKAMTAALVGYGVERSKLDWTTTASAVFPEWTDQFHSDLKNVTVRQLLSHRAGLKANLNWSKFGRGGHSIREQRLAVVKEALTAAPEHAPGGAYLYSNLGYVIVGAMLERRLDQPWEEAMLALIFRPLGMRGVGFGGTGTPGKLDQPWGHTREATPVSGNGPDLDNPPVLGPAGRVHAPLADWALLVADLLRGLRGEPALLRPETYQALVTPPEGADYALGWQITREKRGGGMVLRHAGCNTMNFANAWVAPARNLAVLVCVNQGDDQARKASERAIDVVLEWYETK